MESRRPRGLFVAPGRNGLSPSPVEAIATLPAHRVLLSRVQTHLWRVLPAALLICFFSPLFLLLDLGLLSEVVMYMEGGLWVIWRNVHCPAWYTQYGGHLLYFLFYITFVVILQIKLVVA